MTRGSFVDDDNDTMEDCLKIMRQQMLACVNSKQCIKMTYSGAFEDACGEEYQIDFVVKHVEHQDA